MEDKIKRRIYSRNAFFSDSFPFAIRYLENRSDEFNLSRRFQRQFWKITLITEGKGYFVVGDRKFPFRKNTLIIVHPKELTTWDITGKKIMLYNIVFDNTLIPAEFSKLEDPFHLQRIFSPELDSENTAPWQIMSAGRKICSLIRTIHAEFESHELNREVMLRLYFHQLLLMLIRQSERKYRRHPDWTANYVQEYVRKNYASDISLRKLALELHLSPERLCRLYKAHFSHTIRAEINSLRVKKACALLKAGALNTAEICRLSGFHDASNFYRIFRSFTNKTPQQFRQTDQKACKAGKGNHVLSGSGSPVKRQPGRHGK